MIKVLPPSSQGATLLNSPAVANTLQVGACKTYRTKAAVREGWRLGNDFRVMDMFHRHYPHDRRYVSIRDKDMFEINTTVICEINGNIVVLGTYPGKAQELA